MAGAGDTDRLGRALVPVVALALAVGVVASVTYEPSGTPVARSTSEITAPGASLSPTDPPPSTGVAATDPAATAPAVAETTTTSAPPLGPTVVPAAGTYRYDVDSVRDGESSTRSETRQISILGEEGGVAVVQIVAESQGERQVSELEWAAAGVSVRATRIETNGESSRDCAWEPAFTEFGALEPGSSWTVDSTCTTDVAGLPTRFVVTGTGRVAGEVEVVQSGTPVRAWQVERDRTTIIAAAVGDETIEQQVREVGTFFIDPARGLVLRSDVTVTLTGSQQGTTRRTSVLAEG